ncbi:GAF domain-containing protein [Oceanobacillus luteolus]|uniref:GAF domain-containing protein n=1 Tax=Oceanobacillus luteolus TaxID=1274358 RepID=A0ABW4HUZ0_9BACI|nr:GAF domain-containing protein [Oceanobacillus luteolus]MCM3739392.1 GAF domain-containing protein [Oceanobacillus luteolus]
MFQQVTYSDDRMKGYELLIKQLHALSEDEKDQIALLANAASLLNQFLDEVNWVGFYLWKDEELVLGPFQGLPACVRIPYGRGVCGTAIKEKKTQLVPDVHAFPGHIACDAASNSEIVVPMIINGEIYGVLDIDSPIKERFDETDQLYLEKFVDALSQYL